jgi:MFS family permease
VVTLGLVSLLMDASSEAIHSLLPVFLTVTLGASPALLGWIEGLSEAAISVTKVFSGWLSDRMGARKSLTVLGYGLAALSKPLFPLAAVPAAVLAARLFDRVGKGIRGAPRDALIADVTPPDLRGAAFGLRQTLDTVGAVVGPLLALGLMELLGGRIRLVFWWAIPFAVGSVVLLIVGVKEAAGRPRPNTPFPLSARAAASLGRAFWIVAGLASVFTLSRFSEAFLILRAAREGLPTALTPLVLVVENLVYALVAAPAGRLSDIVGRRGLLAASLVVLVAADASLGLWNGLAGAFVGTGLWGLHMGLSQGLFAALVADVAPPDRRGTAFGLFYLVTGAAALAASGIAGSLWQAFGPAVTFAAGAGFAVLTLAGLGLLPRRPAGR